MKKLFILGIRGIPARHGGFETFAEKLSLYLTKNGWDVTVYCQEAGEGDVSTSQWHGINRIHIPVSREGAAGTVIFDWKATTDALGKKGLFLTLGYNTALFNVLQRIKGQVNVINMDGIEWKRDKWGSVAKAWFWLNERAGCWVGNHLVADHPLIKSHLATRVSESKVTMIPYGGDQVLGADATCLDRYGLKENGFSIVIARPEPENSFFEIVEAFSSKVRNHKLVVLGNFAADKVPYHKKVMDAASDEVIFPGAIYEQAVVQALRFYSRFYIHGHRVGGTNPSLVEALGAGCAVIAHDNQFNRWVAGDAAVYFRGQFDCASLFDAALDEDYNSKVLLMKAESARRFQESFTWENILSQYEKMLATWYPEKLLTTLVSREAQIND
jgi:glycosyltransferase involved in cell wall biosynthesis